MTNQRGSGDYAEVWAHWTVLLGCFIGILFGITSVFGYTVGVFIKPLAAEFGWTRTQVSLGLLLSTATTAITSPLVGYIADRFNLRKIVIAATLGLALSFLLFANLWPALWLFMALMTIKSFLSCGTSPVVYTRIINQWFVRNRGLALGLALAGNGVAGVFFPVLLAGYVQHNGWRAGYYAIVVAVLVTAPLIWLLIRDRRYALTDTAAVAAARRDASGTTLREAAALKNFWLVGAVLLVPAIGMGGLAIHLIPMLTDAGLTPRAAGGIASIMGLAVIVGRVLTGSLIDRFFAPRVAAVIFFMAALGCVGLAVNVVDFAPYCAFLVGLAAGAEVDIIGYLIVRYFGMKTYGLLYGLMYTAFMLGTSLSQLVASRIYDVTGDYGVFLLLAGGCLALGAAMTFLLNRFPDDHPGRTA